MGDKAARWFNIVLGAWLFISAFVWPHSPSQHTNTWIMGVVVVVFALIASGASGLRFVNTAAAIWIIISAFALPTISAATRWNNFVVGIVVGLVSLVGVSPSATPITGRPRTT